jgi:hypothetical protein
MLDRSVCDGAAPCLPSPRPSVVVLAAIAALAAPATGCSDETESAAATTGASTTGPTGSERFGAVNLEIYAQPMQTCPVGNVHIDIGNVKTEPPQTVSDGFAGASVTCTVAQVALQFVASGSIVQESGDPQKSRDFSFSGLETEGVSGLGMVAIKDPADGTKYESNMDKPCVFQFIESAGHSVTPGRISVQFDCTQLVSEANSADTCSLRFGYVLLDKCNTVP